MGSAGKIDAASRELGPDRVADAPTAAQADAFANLFDALGITRVAIVAMSGGVPP
jgi:hypothetical protein